MRVSVVFSIFFKILSKFSKIIAFGAQNMVEGWAAGPTGGLALQGGGAFENGPLPPPSKGGRKPFRRTHKVRHIGMDIVKKVGGAKHHHRNI